MQLLDAQLILQKLQSAQQEEQKLAVVAKLQEAEIKQLFIEWRRLLKDRNWQQLQPITCILKYVLQGRAAEVATQLWFTKQQMKAVGLYIDQNSHIDHMLYICLQVVEASGDNPFCQPQFFQNLLKQFELITDNQVRYRCMLLLLQSMTHKQQLIQYGNNPYYFLQYFVYELNQEQTKEPSESLLRYIRKLNLCPHSEELFTGSDYKAIVDVLVRHIHNCSSEESLSGYLEDYLVLSINPKIIQQGQYYKIDQILLTLAEIHDKTLRLNQLQQEIQQLKTEQL